MVLRQKIKHCWSSGIRFFIFSEGRPQSSFLLAMVIFFLELFFSLYLIAALASNNHFHEVMTGDNRLVLVVAGFFFLRVLLLYLLFGFLLRLLEYAFAIRWKKSFYALILGYMVLYLFTKVPQIFEDFPRTSELLDNSLFWRGPAAIFYFGLILVLFLNIQGLKTLIGAGFKRKISWLVGNAFVVYFLFFSQVLVPPLPVAGPVAAQQTAKKFPHIVVVTLDSIRGDTDLTSYGANQALQGFLNKSWRFDRVITPIAQTHAALTGLLTGEDPVKSRVRNNLSSRLLDTDGVLNQTSVDVLREAGYQIEFLQDNQEYAFFREGKTIQKVEAPHFPSANFFISPFFKDPVIFGFFNNWLGHLFLPEIKDNVSFAYSYHVANFSEKVLKKIAELENETRPTFLFVHTCAVHWPGVLPYPYYPQEGIPDFAKIRFSYTSKFMGLNQKLNPDQWKVQSAFNQSIYKSGLSMLTKYFLNPVVEQAEKSGLLKNSVFILASDHGENFWKGDTKFPRNRNVEHGGSLIFGADAEFSSLHISFPGQGGRVISQNVGLIDVLPTVIDFLKLPPPKVQGRSFLGASGPSEYYYTETGLWPFAFSDSQFAALPAWEMGPVFKLDWGSQFFYVDPAHLPGIIQQKQRAIYKGPFRYTLFPSVYGDREFICDRSQDYFCLRNLISQRPDLTQAFRAQMKTYLDHDVEDGSLKRGLCSGWSGGQAFDSKDLAAYQWQYFYQAVECYRDWHDYGYATKLFQSLIDAPGVSSYIKSYAENTLIMGCGKDLVFTLDTAPTYIRTGMIEKMTDLGERGRQSRRFYNMGMCLKTIEDGRGYQEFLRFANKEKILRYDPPHDERIDGTELEKVESNTSQANESPEPKSKKKDPDILSLEMIRLRNRNHPERIKAEAARVYADEINYGFTTHLVPFLGNAMVAAFLTSEAAGLVEIAEQLSHQNMPVSYFNYLLDKTDRKTISEGLPPVQNLRIDSQNFLSHQGAFPIRDLEVGLALYKLKRHLCKPASGGPCGEIQKLCSESKACELWRARLAHPDPYRPATDLPILAGRIKDLHLLK